VFTSCFAALFRGLLAVVVPDFFLTSNVIVTIEILKVSTSKQFATQHIVIGFEEESSSQHYCWVCHIDYCNKPNNIVGWMSVLLQDR